MRFNEVPVYYMLDILDHITRETAGIVRLSMMSSASGIDATIKAIGFDGKLYKLSIEPVVNEVATKEGTGD